MSSIPKSKRSESKLETLDKAYNLRARITSELLASFGYSEKKREAFIRSRVAYIQDEEAREAVAEVIRAQEDSFDCWFIKRERDRILDFCQEITSHLRAANTIYPKYMNEFLERRLEMDRALCACNKLQDELQYIATTLPADKNKYMSIVLDVEAVFRMIKKLRQSDNRFLKELEDAR